jgi:hypothetical protein
MARARAKYLGGAILALDSATRTGVACGEPGLTPVLETVNFGRELDDQFDIWSRAQVWLIRRINEAQALGQPIGLLVLEGLVPKYDKTIQCGIYAIFGAIARNKEIPVLEAPVRTWRAFILGNGGMKGALAKRRSVDLARSLGWQPKNHDAAEASMQWLWACSQVAPRQAHRFEPLFTRPAGAIAGVKRGAA